MLDSYKIAEYLKVYSELFGVCKSKAAKYIADASYELLVRENESNAEVEDSEKESMFEMFQELIASGETSLEIDDFEKMLFIKDCFSISHLLNYKKDIFIKGLNNVDGKIKKFINLSSPINQKCINNYKDVDIVNYIRNAIAHTSKNLCEFSLDTHKKSLHIRFMKTKATKGPNKGQIVPFELEIDISELLLITLFCQGFSNLARVTEANVKKSKVREVENMTLMNWLREIVDSAYYRYTIFKPLTNKSKERINTAHIEGNAMGNMDTYRREAKDYIRKEQTRTFSQVQKNCIYLGILKNINNSVISTESGSKQIAKLTPLELKKIKEILPALFYEFFEYEALKVVPLGAEKTNIHIASILVSFGFGKRDYLRHIIHNIAQDFYNHGSTYNLFCMFNQDDKEEQTMFTHTLYDTEYLEEESLALYYEYVFENFVADDEKIKIGNVELEAKNIRDAFTHGRWYFDEGRGFWELFNSTKPDEFTFDWHKSISNELLKEFVDNRFLKAKTEKENKSIIVVTDEETKSSVQI